MEDKLEKRYGLLTAISMVVGIVIGSGVFFKAEKVLLATGGSMPLGILSWLLGGIVMISCAYTFALMAHKYEDVNGVVDYARVAIGDRYSYYVGWFLAVIYYPSLASVLSWVTAKYTCVLFGLHTDGGEVMVIAAFYLILSYAINTLSPRLAGKIQVSATILKLVPLILMAILGTIVGMKNGILVENFTTVTQTISKSKGLFSAVVATAFAYEGWIVATSINAELKNAKRNLPIALTLGSIIVIAVYTLYYIGLAGGVEKEVLMQNGQHGVKIAFSNIFTSIGGSLLFVFVIISCIGTLNGIMLGGIRGMYVIAVRNHGPRPDIFKEVDKTTKIPVNSGIIGLLLCAFCLLYFYGSQLTDSWFGKYWFDISELPIITIYSAYIPIFASFMKTEKSLSVFKRFIVPSVAILSCCFMIVAAIYSHETTVVWYLIAFAIIMFIGNLFLLSNNK